jgi:hypothetical protein
MTAEDELQALMNFIDESVALRDAGERLPPSFYQRYEKQIPGRASVVGQQSNNVRKSDKVSVRDMIRAREDEMMQDNSVDEILAELFPKEIDDITAHANANSRYGTRDGRTPPPVPQGVNRSNKTDLSKAEEAFGKKIK